MCSCSSRAETPWAVSWPPIQSVSSTRHTLRPARAAASAAATPPVPPPTTSTSQRRSSMPSGGSPSSTRAWAESPPARTAMTSRSVVTISRAQVELADHVGAAQLHRGAVQGDVSRFEKVGAVGQLEGHGRVLLHEDDGEAAARQLADGARDLAHHDGSEAERRLVEEQAAGPGHEPAPDGEHLLLAARERAAALLPPLAQPREELVYVLEIAGDGAAIRALIGAHAEIVEHGELGEDLPTFGHQHEAAGHALEGQEARDVLVEVAHGPARELLEAGDDAESGGLARRVGSDHADDLATLDAQAHVVEHVHLGIVAVDALKREHGRCPGTPRRRQARSAPLRAGPPRSSPRS